MDIGPIGFKVKIIQETEVYIYYQEGLVIEAPQGEERLELERIAIEDALDLACGDDGLVIKLHEETETSNGFIAFVQDFDPDVDIEYTIRQMPSIIAAAIEKKQKENNNGKR